MRPEIIDRRIEKIHDILISSDYRHYDARELAHTCCLSISQMNRLFLRTFHRSPQKFWEGQRLSAICVALKRNADPIGEIASEFGFDEPAYFSRWFKKRAGCSAIAYREKLVNSGSV
ncbi:MAG: AraC family transcriptional regulator [Phycisphaerae bacterium]|nr:AraC family transcriptional regulator [Phycisphaerae bacterium]